MQREWAKNRARVMGGSKRTNATERRKEKREHNERKIERIWWQWRLRLWQRRRIPPRTPADFPRGPRAYHAMVAAITASCIRELIGVAFTIFLLYFIVILEKWYCCNIMCHVGTGYMQDVSKWVSQLPHEV